MVTSVLGAYLSYFLNGATGGIIVLLMTGVFLIAFVFAPKHGLLAARARARAALKGEAAVMSEIVSLLAEPFQFTFMLKAMLIAVLLAVPMGILSCFLVLKGWSLMGDAVSHAVLPGW
jgi:ABC-type Mn2+/Zn2+ transport system permease subunit